MIITGFILLFIAIVLAVGGVLGVYCDISFAFDNLMKVFAVILGAISTILLIVGFVSLPPGA